MKMTINKPTAWVVALGLTCIMLWSCEADLDPDVSGNPNNPNNPGNPNPGTGVDPDQASEYLVLNDGFKVTGNLPAATDGQLKMDVEDTIFVIKGHPMGRRIEVLHQLFQNVSGFNISVAGASYYYDVPETIIEGQYTAPEESDTISVLVLDLDPPSDQVSYPLTIEIIIQPYDESGTPLDEFNRWVTVEDTEDQSAGDCNSIIRPLAGGQPIWLWDFTVREYNGEILDVWAPGLASRINSQGGGCCGSNGSSYTSLDHPACYNNTTSSEMTWVVVSPDDYYVRTFEFISFWPGGEIDWISEEIIKTWNLFTTDFCSGTLGYSYEENLYLNRGTHNFSPGADQIDVDFPNWEGSWRPPARVEIKYTCHTLMMSWGLEDKFTAVYKQLERINEITDFYDQWKQWFD